MALSQGVATSGKPLMIPKERRLSWLEMLYAQLLFRLMRLGRHKQLRRSRGRRVRRKKQQKQYLESLV